MADLTNSNGLGRTAKTSRRAKTWPRGTIVGTGQQEARLAVSLQRGCEWRPAGGPLAN
jgi:hypothetical protein